MNKKLIGLLVGSALLFAACGSESEAESSNTEESSIETVTVTDANGERVEVPKNPEKVVVYDMGILDSLDELGLDESVVGTVIQNLPDYLTSFEESAGPVGSLKEPDLEAVYELDPDLILISGRQLDFLEELNEIAPTVYLGVDLENYWDSFEENMITLGKIFSVESEVEVQLDTLRSEAEALREQAQNSDQTSLVTILNEGNLSAFGDNSRYGMIYEDFGFKPVDETIKSSTHGQSVSYEYILSQDPDLLFVVDRAGAIGGDVSNNNLSSNPVIQETRAYQDEKIIYLDPELWYLSGGGLRSMRMMMEEIKEQVEL